MNSHRHLYVMRHGIAESTDDRWLNDRVRPLAEEGRRRTLETARALVANDVIPDLILHSPYLRAQQTAEIIQTELNVTRMEMAAELAPNTDPRDLERLLERVCGTDMSSVMVVGHEPHCSATVSYFCTGDSRLHVDMKKGAVASLRFRHGSISPPATLEWLISPHWVGRAADKKD